MTDISPETTELIERISLKLEDFSAVRAELLALQGRLMELRRGDLYPPPISPHSRATK